MTLSLSASPIDDAVESGPGQRNQDTPQGLMEAVGAPAAAGAYERTPPS
jgi:hypothetical protein